MFPTSPMQPFRDVSAVTEAPVTASHSNARALADHVRNLDDAMLRAVAETGVIVMVSFGGPYFDPQKADEWKVILGRRWLTHPRQQNTPLSFLVDHIDLRVLVRGELRRRCPSPRQNPKRRHAASSRSWTRTTSFWKAKGPSN